MGSGHQVGDFATYAPIYNGGAVTETIGNQAGASAFDLKSLFTSAPGGTLKLSATGLPNGLTLGTDGILRVTDSSQTGSAGDYTLKVTADDNILPLIKTEVRNGVLVLSTDSGYTPKSSVVFEVTAKAVRRIENSGTVSIDASGFNGGDFKLEASGVGSATLAGKVDSLKLALSGVGSVDAEGLAADRVVAEMSGVGSGSVRAEKSLKADVSGVGSLTWKGAATEVSTNVSGIGRVSRG